MAVVSILRPVHRVCVVATLLAWVVCVAAATSRAADEPKPLLTILYTAEAHAALLPCDCPLQPLGGVARRATAIQRYRQRGPVILVDGGGWAAGGIYDEDADGNPHRDTLRSELMFNAMKMMNYDSIAMSPLDLTYHVAADASVPIATAMPKFIDGKLDVPIRIFGWEEASAKIIPLLANAPPGKFNALHTDRYFDIHLARFGEETAENFAAITHADLIINAGRKSTQRVGWNVADTTLANFDFQAERLGVVEVWPAAPGDSRKYDLRVRFEPLTSEIADDPAVAEMLKPHLDELKKKGKEKIAVEFWTMPECPGCIQARPDLQRIAADLSARVDMSVHFVIHHEDGKLASLHGERELQEARVQSIVCKYYPARIWDWLAWRESAREASWEEGAKKFGMLAARIRGALAENECDALLEADYELMQRRHVDGTPSLVIANRLYQPTDGAIERLPVLRVLCGSLSAPQPAACKDVPACFFDAQCRKRGFIGKCSDAGKPAAACDFSRPAVPVQTIVIDDKDNIFDNHEHILELMAADLPGLTYKVVDISEPDGKAWAERLKLTRLPAYVLDPIAKTEVGYEDSVGKVLFENKDAQKLVVKPLLVGSHRLLNRPRIKGRADLIVSRFSRNGQESLETALNYVKVLGSAAPDLIVHDAVYFKTPPGGAGAAGGKLELAASEGIAELEEDSRALAVKQLAPDRCLQYLLERGKARGSSYWDAPLKKLGIDAEQVRALAEGPSDGVMKQLYAEAEYLKNIEGGGDITFLGENCELIPIRSREDLRHAMETIGRRRK